MAMILTSLEYMYEKCLQGTRSCNNYVRLEYILSIVIIFSPIVA